MLFRRHLGATTGGAVIVVTGLLLLSCSQLEKSMENIAGGGDISGEVHTTDLSARFPRPIRNGGVEDPPARTEVYPGSPQHESNLDGPAGKAASSAVQTSAVRSGEGYNLNFENADIAAVAKALLGDVLGVGYAVDRRVQGTMSLASGRPVARGDIIPLFESALKIANANLVKEAGLYKIVPLGEALGAGTTDRGKIEPGYGISVLPLRHISGQAVVRALESFATRPGAIRADQSRNVLLIQGTSTERAAAIETALALDVDWMKSQSVGVFPVRNTSPEAIIPELQSIFDSGKEGQQRQRRQ
jgi:general secretion pathway protein D